MKNRSMPSSIAGRSVGKRRGSMLVLCSVTIAMLVVLMVMIVDFAWMALVKTELRAAADNAARGALTSYIEDSSSATVARRTARATRVGQSLLTANRQGREKISLDGAKLEFGNRVNNKFLPGLKSPTSVRVTIDTAKSKGVSLLLASIIGRERYFPRVSATTTFQPIDVVLLLDVSRSMTFKPNTDTGANKLPDGVTTYNIPPQPGARWFPAVDATKRFIDIVSAQAPVVRISLVTFGGGVFHAVATSQDDNFARIETDFTFAGASRKPIAQKLDDYTAHVLPWATSHYAGFEQSLSILAKQSNSSTERIIIVLSDGRQSNDDRRDPMLQIQEAQKAGVKVHSVYFSGDPKGFKPMHDFATYTGGLPLVANNEAELNAAYETIADSIRVKMVE